jgi:dTDP-4-amino-4,6-dideoxygalactose transaminase
MSKLAINGGARALECAVPHYNPHGPEERAAGLRVLESGRLSDFHGSWGENFLGGPEVRALEAEWSAYFDVPYSVSVNSATSGLIAAVGACGVGPGDEVIVSPFTMCASATCVRVLGGTPVFADVCPDTFNLDPHSVAEQIGPRTKAIVVVDLAGQPADLAEIVALACERGIRVIEDAAQAAGARYQGRWAGTLADIGVFSLNCHKTIHTGEGGLCCTRDRDLATRLQLLRNHGEAVVEDMGYRNAPESIVGFNFRLGEIEAAIAREQLKKLDRLTTPRRKIAAVFDERLGALEGLSTPVVRADRTHVYYTYMLKLDETEAGFSRRMLARALAAEGVPVFEGYCRPLYRQPLYQSDWPGKDGRRYEPGLCPVAEALYERELFFMPNLHAEVRDTVMEPICRAFEKVWTHRDELKQAGADEPDPHRGP